jgi:hypothetical protein
MKRAIGLLPVLLLAGCPNFEKSFSEYCSETGQCDAGVCSSAATACNEDSLCCSGTCRDNKCLSCQSAADKCDTANAQRGGCCPGLECQMATSGSYCCRPIGQPCGNPPSCCGGFCSNGICTVSDCIPSGTKNSCSGGLRPCCSNGATLQCFETCP